jgi:hypothetical protein
MKRVMISMLCIIAGLMSISAAGSDVDPSYSDARVSSLSGAYTAVADDPNALYLNPAGLNRMNSSSMSIRLDLIDQLNGDFFTDTGLTKVFEQPVLNGEFIFTDRNWGIAAYTKYDMAISQSGDQYDFDVVKVNSLRLGFAAGLGPFSFGLDVRAIMQNPLYETSFTTDETVGVIIPFLQEIILHEYSSSLGHESVVMGAGVLLDLGNVTLGAYSDEVLNLMEGDESEISFSAEDVLRGLNAGIAYKSSVYTKYGDFRPLQFTAAVDLHDLGDPEIRTIVAGMEANLRFLEYAQFALRLGYAEPLAEFDELLFGLSMKEGVYSVGAGAILPFLKIDASLGIPGEALLHTMNPEGSYAGADVTAQITFGFAF